MCFIYICGAVEVVKKISAPRKRESEGQASRACRVRNTRRDKPARRETRRVEVKVRSWVTIVSTSAMGHCNFNAAMNI